MNIRPRVALFACHKMHQIKLEKFEGPLGLLLQLIEQEKLEITEIALSQVTGSYLSYLKGSTEIPEEELADFLVIAAKLLLLKSKSLLPSLSMEAEEGLDLADQLRMYKEFVEAAKKVEALIKKKKFAYFREMALRSEDIGFFPPRGLKVGKIKKMFEEILEKIRPWVDLPRQTLGKTISIKEKIFYIQGLLKKGGHFGFRQLLRDAQTKAEIIVSFLALLELIKQQTIAVVQDEMFEEIVVEGV